MRIKPKSTSKSIHNKMLVFHTPIQKYIQLTNYRRVSTRFMELEKIDV
jgi:hypothetical protein